MSSVRSRRSLLSDDVVLEHRDQTLDDFGTRPTYCDSVPHLVASFHIDHTRDADNMMKKIAQSLEIVAVRVDTNTVFVSDILAADYVEQFGESISDMI